ncbi:hypothetical protein KDA23_01355 [Candidatus Saccharibacteria bacterium]|nr:hypothetical protein [Candidatus Saccharibacteria bacterium]
MIWEDPIVKEVREIRQQIAAEHNNDIDALCRYLREQEKHEHRKLVTLAAKKP